MTDSPKDRAEELLRLATLVEGAAGADRELDLAIAVEIGFDDRITQLVARARRGLDCEPGEVWELGDKHVLYAVWNEHCCYANGGYLLPAFTASIDAAMQLVPEGWTIARLTQGDNKSWWGELRKGFLTSYSTVIIVPTYKGEPPVSGIATLPLALTSLALRARAAGEA